MALTVEDRNEIRSIVSDGMSGIHAITIAQNDKINIKLDGLALRMDMINGRIGKNEDKIEGHDNVINQALQERLANRQKQEMMFAKLPELEIAVRKLQDEQLSTASIKKWIVGSVAIIGTLLGILWVSINIYLKTQS